MTPCNRNAQDGQHTLVFRVSAVAAALLKTNWAMHLLDKWASKSRANT